MHGDPPATISARSVLGILRAVALCGVPCAELLRRAGVAAADVADPNARLPIALVTELWETPATMTGDPFFALHAAERARGLQLDLAEWMFASGASLRDAVERTDRYAKDGTDLFGFWFESGAQHDGFRFGLGRGTRFPSRQGAEWIVARNVFIARSLYAPGWNPTRAVFQHEAPAGAEEVERVLGCPVVFGADGDGLDVPRGDLDRPFVTASTELGGYLADHCAALVERAQTGTLVERVRTLLSEGLDPVDTQVEVVARRLRMSERTLQRRLGEEGTTFRKVVDDLRRALAIHALTDLGLDAAEAGRLAGFSHAAPFSRAFRRWTGLSPRAFVAERRTARAAPKI